ACMERTGRFTIPVAMMLRILVLLALWTFLPPAAFAQPAQPGPPPPLLLTGAKVLASAADRWVDGVAGLIADGRIASVASVDAIHAPAGVQRIDLAGGYLIPGLIDLHTHLMLRPYDQMSWDDQVLKESLELRTIRATVSARQTLEAGFTTI